MLENKVHKALGDISDVHLESAMNAYKRRKRQRNGWIRTTAIAVAVVIAFLMMLQFVTEDDQVMSYFSIYVYANETNSVEMLEGYKLPMGKGPYVSEDNNGLGSDHPYFNSSISPIDDQDAFFRFDIIPDESILAVAIDRFAVFCNGERVEFNLDWAKDPTSQHIIVNRLRSTDPDIFPGYCVHGILKEDALLDIVLYDEEGNVLQINTVLVQPVEGGYMISMKNFHIAESV